MPKILQGVKEKLDGENLENASKCMKKLGEN